MDISKRAWQRLVALMLVLCLAFSLFPFGGYASEANPEASATATDGAGGSALELLVDGEAVASAVVYTDDHRLLTASYTAPEGASGSPSYLWQIYAPEEACWISISGAESRELQVGPAMLASALNSQGVAYINCKVTDGELCFYSDTVQLELQEPEKTPEEPEIQTLSLDGEALPMPVVYTDPVTGEEVTTTLEELPAEETAAPTESPEATEAPAETVAPTETEIPEETVAPMEEPPAAEPVEETAEPTESPEATEAPAETVTPTETEIPEETVAPIEETPAEEAVEETAAPVEEAPEAEILAPVADEEAMADGTAPVETETPEETAEPTETETPEETAEPTETETPEETAEPTKTETPEETAEPNETETLETPAETAEPTESPEATEAPAEPAPQAVAMGLDGAEGTEGGELITYEVRVDYIYYNEQATAAQSYVATVKPLETATLVGRPYSPTIVGFSPYILTKDGKSEACGGERFTAEDVGVIEGVVELVDAQDNRVYGKPCSMMTVPLSGIETDIVYEVYYFPKLVTYTVNHYVQNIVNDDYILAYVETKQGRVRAMTEASDLTEDATGATLDLTTGFYALKPFGNQEIAADGSTQIDVYYDRLYYLMRFKLGDGRGVQPVYARYGAPVSVGTPTLQGYVFDHWVQLETNKDGQPVDENGTVIQGNDASLFVPKNNGAEVQIPATMPAANTTYLAVYQAASSHYTVVYWLERADYEVERYDTDGNGVVDENERPYDYWCSTNVEAATGAAIDLDKWKDPTTAGVLASGDQYYDEFHYFQYCETTVKAQDGQERDGAGNYLVMADGNTVVNVYYERKVYNLRFFYARSSGSGTNTKYEVVGGSINKFATTESDSVVTLLDSLASDQWGQVEAPADGEWYTAPGGMYETDTETSGNYTYYAIKFSARYGQDISDEWPSDIFQNVTRSDSNKDASGGYTWQGTQAVFSAWCGEHYIQYNVGKGNYTIKGNYQVMDETLMYRSSYPNYYDRGTGEDDNLDFAAFWENGNKTGWSIPSQFHYYLWTEDPDQSEAAVEAARKDASITFIEVTDGSELPDGRSDFEGLAEKTTKLYIHNKLYTLYDKVDCCDNAPTPGEQTPTTLVGYDHVEDGFGNTYYDTSKAAYAAKEYCYQNSDYDTTTYRNSYSLHFRYTPAHYTITLRNHNTEIEIQDIPAGSMYGAQIIQGTYDWDTNPGGFDVTHKAGYDEAMMTVHYPEDMVQGAYEFKGWYKSKTLDESSKADFTIGMPKYNMVLYAKWEPKQFNVKVYQTSGKNNLVYYAEKNSGDHVPLEWTVAADGTGGLGYGDFLPATVSTEGPDTTIVENPTTGVKTATIPENISAQDAEGGTGDIRANWVFVCYAYEKNGVEYAIDTSAFTVTEDVELYAKWTASSIVKYEVKYVLADLKTDSSGNILDSADQPLTFDDQGQLRYGDGTVWAPAAQLDDNGEPKELASPSSGSQNEGANRTFRAKTGNELYPAYQQGNYYPLTSSHTVLMIPEDGDEGVVEFVFYYIEMEEVPYTVKYLDAYGNTLVDSRSETSRDAVVTENYVYVENHVADALQKTLVLSANVQENEIVFYYTIDTGNGMAPYTIVYYYQVFDDVYDMTLGEKRYRQYTTTSGSTGAGDLIAVSNMSITGYEYQSDRVTLTTKTTTTGGTELVPSDPVVSSRAKDTLKTNDSTYTLYDAIGEELTVTANGQGYIITCQHGHSESYTHTLDNTTLYVDGVGAANRSEVRAITVNDQGYLEFELYVPLTEFSVTSGDGGTLIEVFYDLKYYPYYVYHRIYGTNEVLESEQGRAQFQDKLERTSLTEQQLIELLGKPGYTVDSENKAITITMTISITIQDDAESPAINTINFYYYEKDLSYFYETMLLEDRNAAPDADTVRAFGDANAELSLYHQSLTVVTGEADYSEPIHYETAYEFLGWYLDEACTQPVANDPTYYTYLRNGDGSQALPAPTGTDISAYTRLEPQKQTTVNYAIYDENGQYHETGTKEVAGGIYAAEWMATTDENGNPTAAYAKEQTFYALFAPLQGTLTIRRESYGPDMGHNEANSFVYTITQTADVEGNPPDTPVELQVTIDPKSDAVAVGQLPFGTYTVTQENSWSWRYGDGAKEDVTVDGADSQIVFNGGITNTSWLSGFGETVKNLFKEN